MNCRIFQINIIDYQEDKLSPSIKREMDIHLSSCKSCEQLLSGFQTVEAIIANARKAESNPFMRTRIIQHVENELSKKRENRVVILRPILYTLSILGAIALGFVVGRAGSDRINRFSENNNQNQIENLRTGLYIHDFIDENKTLFVNE